MKFFRWRQHKEEELEAEIQAHLELSQRDRRERGETAEEARAASRREFGNVGLVKEVTREMWGWASLERLRQDLRFGVRMLRKNPGFSLVVILTLALGIGANTAIFSAVDAILLRPLPYSQPEHLVILSETGRDGSRLSISYPNYSDWRERAQSFAGMASFRSQSFNLTGVDKPTQLRGRTVNWNFFHLLGVPPRLGRLFGAEDDRFGSARTVLLSHGMWQEKFGGDTSVIGRKLLLNGQPYELIGVLPPGFEYFQADDVYVPIGLLLGSQMPLINRGNRMGLYTLARLKPGVTLEQANSEMAGIAAQLEGEYPETNSGRSARAEPLQKVMSEEVSQSLWVLLGAVGFILLIACVNIANLLLVRASDRQKEIALRLALGAGRGRIVRQLFTESLLLALLGGGFGVLVGRWMLAGLLALAPGNIPQINRIGLSGTVLLFTLGISVLTSILCGLLPALHALRPNLHLALKEGGRSDVGAARDTTRKTLLVVEVGLALVLLIGAGLLVRSMVRVLSVEPGFNPEHLLTMRVMLPNEAYPVPRRLTFYEDCLARLGALPGVHSAALTHSLPIAGIQWGSVFIVADKPVPPRSELPGTALIPVSANYFETMGMRLLKGRAFTSADTSSSPHVTIINETLARRIWPGEDPIGKRLKQGFPEDKNPWREVIGVVSDVKLNGVEEGTPSQAYLPFVQETQSSFTLVVRSTGDPLLAAASVEAAIHAIDKDLPVFAIRSMDQLLGNSRAQRRLTLTLLSGLAALALVLAAVGIYGVMAYSVRQRTHELGVRMALGANTGDVLKLILAQGLKLALLGVALGLLAAFALTRWMGTLLFNVRPTDPLTFTAVAAVLLLVVLCASWIPARRATRVDPLVALRHE